MGNGMNKILPGLFLGNIVAQPTSQGCCCEENRRRRSMYWTYALPRIICENKKDAKDLDQLSRNDITHIVSIHESPQPFIPGITYLRIVLPDTPEANIKKHFKKCIHFIHSCRLQGGNCLVHCLAGISRSTTIVLAYLMAVTQQGWLEALEAVKAVRPVANPNLGFRRQLEEFGRSRSVQKIRRKLQPPPRETLFNDCEALRGLLPSGRKLEAPNPERPSPAPGPKSTGSGVKHLDSFLIRVKDTFSCLPSCLK